ncbi:poly [ADP-ribose] polymerase [Plakobranchus ocellatus]|uniref:Poly [ADP-ribose] polymerase n=1 Tax=Plakobranchus ocellatus TaxID=259542 RepID=A0AAV4B6F6_9GAST|nr:poly [ADP-ribose] polymerase [Plakobranchus ocellatus]
MTPGEDDVNTTDDAIPCDSAHKEQEPDVPHAQAQVPMKTIENVLREAKMEGDFLWSLFVSAAKSYRFSSILHPFPPMYNAENGTEKHMFALRETVSQMPQFSSTTEFINQLPVDCHNLLSWIFQKPKFELKLQEKEECFKHIRSLTGQVMDAPEPTYVFEVVYDCQEEEKFKARRGLRKNFYAYHGSRMDNFYSILHNGLNGHLNKVAAFGEGTYLSSELSVSLLYSQAGETWSKSCLGAKLACVAVCEMIDEPSVKCQVKEGSTSVQKQRAQASSITDAVPEKYYVVQNNDAVRVKYLLVYRDNSAPLVPQGSSPSSSWVQEHKFPLLMLAYVILLLAIGLANSRQAVKAFTRFYKQFYLS